MYIQTGSWSKIYTQYFSHPDWLRTVVQAFSKYFSKGQVKSSLLRPSVLPRTRRSVMRLCLEFWHHVYAISKFNRSSTLISCEVFVMQSRTSIPPPRSFFSRSLFRCNRNPSNMSSDLLSPLTLTLIVCNHGLKILWKCLILTTPFIATAGVWV